MAVSYVELLILALAVGLLLSARTRVAGLGLLVILVTGAVLLSLRVSARPSKTLVNVNSYPADASFDFDQQRLADEARAKAEEVRARAAAEVLKNQRLAARMSDAVLQISPDGSRLETYPDGMQIREDYTSRQRSLMRDADSDPAKRSFYTPYASQSSVRKTFAFGLLGAPLAILAFAFFAVRAKKGSRAGWPAALAILGCVPLLFLFGVRSYSWREVHSGTDATIAEVPLAIGPNDRVVGRSPKFVKDGRGVVIPIPQPVAPRASADSEFARVFARELDDGDKQHGSAIGPASIETLWDKLTRPRIELNASEPAKVSPSKAEVAQAAKIILAASAPVADPFTQGWLINAAKAIVQALPKADEDEGVMKGGSASVSLAEAMEEPIAELTKQQQADQTVAVEYPPVQPYVYEDYLVSEPGAPLKEIDGPRPDWVDDPPQRVGNAQRITVTSDPFTTPEECWTQLQQKLHSVVQTRLGELARAANNGRQVHVPELRWLGIDSAYIAAELCPQGQYVESLSTSVGEMMRVHTLIEFTPAQEQFLLNRWLDYVRMENLGAVAGLSTLVVAGLALVYGLLKVDTWTRGYYTKRLFIGVPAAIIAVLSAAALFVP